MAIYGSGDTIMRKNIKPSKIEAACELVGGAMSDHGDGNIVYHDGQTPPSDSAIETKLAEMITEWEASQYAYKRQVDYPHWGTQLNKIYDDGVTKWKSEMVDPVKAKWPKDNSGPK